MLQKRMQPPWRASHFPTAFGENKPCKEKILTVSGFENAERACLKQMIFAVGGRYTGYLCRKNFVLVAKRLEGQKVAKAMEWGIPVVNAQWIVEILLGNAAVLQATASPRYQQFYPPLDGKTPPNSQHLLQDPFRIDPCVLPHLMNAWRTPIPVSQEVWKAGLERKQRLDNDDGKIFPYKKLRLSPGPEDSDLMHTTPADPLPPTMKPKVIFSGMYPAEMENLKKKVLALGGELTNQIGECSHVVSQDVKRTMKVLKAIALGKSIVTPAWIRQSYKQSRFLDHFPYLVKDEGNENFFGFSLKLSLRNARKRRLFENMMFYLTPSISPGLSLIRDLIEVAGGSVLNQRPPSKKIAEFQQKGGNIVIISCENDLHLCENLIRNNIAIHSAEFVLTGVLRQEVDFMSYRMESPKIFHSSIANPNAQK